MRKEKARAVKKDAALKDRDRRAGSRWGAHARSEVGPWSCLVTRARAACRCGARAWLGASEARAGKREV